MSADNRNDDTDFSGAKKVTNIIFLLGYIGCFIAVAAGALSGSGAVFFAYLCWGVCCALGLYVTQHLILAVFEIVKNTKQIRDELQAQKKMRPIAVETKPQQAAPSPQGGGSMIYNSLTHQYEKR